MLCIFQARSKQEEEEEEEEEEEVEEVAAKARSNPGGPRFVAPATC
jgi:hypothetical protein